MNAVICKDKTQMKRIKDLDVVNDCLLLYPASEMFRIVTFRKAIVLPSVDINQLIGDMKLRTLIEQRQQAFLDAEIIFL